SAGMRCCRSARIVRTTVGLASFGVAMRNATSLRSSGESSASARAAWSGGRWASTNAIVCGCSPRSALTNTSTSIATVRSYASEHQLRTLPEHVCCGKVDRRCHMDVTHVKLGEGGRVVIPAEYRKALGVKPGDDIVLRLQDGE